jgi:hypothetical protein
MKAVGLWVWGIVKVAWWAILLVIGVVFLIGFIRKNRKEREILDDSAEDKAISYVQIAKQKVSEAIVDVKVEQAIVKEKSSVGRKELEAIRSEPDKVARRDKLAKFIKSKI